MGWFGTRRDADLANLPSQDAERLLARHYWEQGYEVEHLGTAATGSRFDGGVDLILRRDGESVLLQCKHWKTAPVPIEDVHQLLSLIESQQAQRGILVVGGEFSDGARDTAKRSGRIELVDGAALRTIVGAADAATSKRGLRVVLTVLIGLLAVAVIFAIRSL